VTTDAEGRWTLTGLVAGAKYGLNFSPNQGGTVVKMVTSAAGELVEVEKVVIAHPAVAPPEAPAVPAGPGAGGPAPKG
jgi:hypothetical protein